MASFYRKGAGFMSKKRRDKKGRILRNGECQQEAETPQKWLKYYVLRRYIRNDEDIIRLHRQHMNIR